MGAEIRPGLYSAIIIESNFCHYLRSNFLLYDKLMMRIINYSKLNIAIKTIPVTEGG
jgi:hypothetical protein